MNKTKRLGKNPLYEAVVSVCNFYIVNVLYSCCPFRYRNFVYKELEEHLVIRTFRTFYEIAVGTSNVC